MIVLRETRQQKQRRIKREMKRVGFLRFLDVLAFRLYYATFLAARIANGNRVSSQSCAGAIQKFLTALQSW